MSCSSIKRRFDSLQANGGVDFNEAVALYDELKGSLEAHKIELSELKQKNDNAQVSQLQQHISDGEAMLSSLQKMTLR